MLQILILLLVLIGTSGISAQETPRRQARPSRSGRAVTPPPTHPPLQPVDITRLPEGVTRLDLFLLMGQSNMKGRGVMPEEPARNPRIMMMHLRDDHWYLARHPLHLTGDPTTFAGHDNAGVGPGLSFAEALAEQDPHLAIGLIPCAVGGSSIQLWQKNAKLYENALRRAKLALQSTAPVQARIKGVLWLQGEANANAQDLPLHEARLTKLITDLRSDLQLPELPFIACTIGELKTDAQFADRAQMNAILLNLSQSVSRTACVDAREFKSHIGDQVHFDTTAQHEIGRRFAKLYLSLADGNSPPP